MNQTNSNDNLPPKPDMGLRALKFIVLSMGFILVGGIILLFAVIYQHNKDYIKSATTNTCFTGEIKLPIAEAESFQLIKNELIIHNDKRIDVVDYCTGKVKKSFLFN